jgi:integrase/recombinase XerD
MAEHPEFTTTTITVFTRHSTDCPKSDPQWKRCNCRKSLYIYEDGKVVYRSAKSRSWEQAEKIAQAERDLRDPVKVELKRIKEQEAAKAAAKQITEITVVKALNRWLASRKEQSPGTAQAYRVTMRKIRDWVSEQSIEYLGDVTPDMLDAWRGQWSPTSLRKDDRMSVTTQSHFLTRLKGFFAYCTRIRLIDIDPAVSLESIAPSSKQTLPLNREQFDQLLQATHLYDAAQRREIDKRGEELRAIFLIMRWTGLRIGDVLRLPRSGLEGNRLMLTTQKTNVLYNAVLPDDVVSVLVALRKRPGVHADYFFWSKTCTQASMTSVWVARIRSFSKLLTFVDDQGNPMEFHSHMLRDTFAVEMLLAGVALEDVSRMLTHESIKVTERYYAPWVKSRQTQLVDKAVAAMRRMGVSVSDGGSQ